MVQRRGHLKRLLGREWSGKFELIWSSFEGRVWKKGSFGKGVFSDEAVS